MTFQSATAATRCHHRLTQVPSKERRKKEGKKPGWASGGRRRRRSQQGESVATNACNTSVYIQCTRHQPASQPASERAAPPCAQLIKTNSFLVPLVFQVQCDTRQIIVVETPLRVASSKNKAGTRRRGVGGGERERGVSL